MLGCSDKVLHSEHCGWLGSVVDICWVVQTKCCIQNILVGWGRLSTFVGLFRQSGVLRIFWLVGEVFSSAECIGEVLLSRFSPPMVFESVLHPELQKCSIQNSWGWDSAVSWTKSRRVPFRAVSSVEGPICSHTRFPDVVSSLQRTHPFCLKPPSDVANRDFPFLSIGTRTPAVCNNFLTHYMLFFVHAEFGANRVHLPHFQEGNGRF